MAPVVIAVVRRYAVAPPHTTSVFGGTLRGEVGCRLAMHLRPCAGRAHLGEARPAAGRRGTVMLRQPAARISPHRKAQLAERACHMRAEMTRSEAALWDAIRRGQLGAVFRRQVVIGGCFIADFAAPAVRVIVEVDGAYHGGRAAADDHRDRKLERLGWRVVRLEAEVVLRNLPATVAAVRAAIASAG